MNKKEIEELIKFVSKAGVSEVHLELQDFKITIKNEIKREQVFVNSSPVQQQYTQAPAIAQPTPAATAAPAPTAPQVVEAAPAADSKFITVHSPMIGTFYRASAPDKPNFVNVGDEIKQGKVICVIEAMKLFNEIECEYSGKIVKVLVDNASPVEYDQPLFIIDPS
jgi:acetyl-CoA carboxylase biotin carboxyl carrier protein